MPSHRSKIKHCKGCRDAAKRTGSGDCLCYVHTRTRLPYHPIGLLAPKEGIPELSFSFRARFPDDGVGPAVVSFSGDLEKFIAHRDHRFDTGALYARSATLVVDDPHDARLFVRITDDCGRSITHEHDSHNIDGKWVAGDDIRTRTTNTIHRDLPCDPNAYYAAARYAGVRSMPEPSTYFDERTGETVYYIDKHEALDENGIPVYDTPSPWHTAFSTMKRMDGTTPFHPSVLDGHDYPLIAFNKKTKLAVEQEMMRTLKAPPNICQGVRCEFYDVDGLYAGHEVSGTFYLHDTQSAYHDPWEIFGGNPPHHRIAYTSRDDEGVFNHTLPERADVMPLEKVSLGTSKHPVVAVGEYSAHPTDASKSVFKPLVWVDRDTGRPVEPPPPSERQEAERKQAFRKHAEGRLAEARKHEEVEYDSTLMSEDEETQLSQAPTIASGDISPSDGTVVGDGPDDEAFTEYSQSVRSGDPLEEDDSRSEASWSELSDPDGDMH